MRVVATAGHVDHGKSTLVRALTGTEPDRWAEERRRGMTIDLGYAWTALPSGEVLAFVDVPGHQRFIGNMLAGLGPAPAVMMVVAADEGWRQQSAEHLAAVDALGLTAGLLVVTRSDLADPREATRQALEQLAGSSLGAVPHVAVSGTTGAGLPQLQAALDELVQALPDPDVTAPVRLWVDRSFTVKGAGTVVTGTLGAGTLQLGDELQLGDARVRVRGLQSLGESRERVAAVARVAVNLRGVERDEVGRGDTLLTPGRWRRADVVDVRLSAAEHLPERVVLHVGSAAVPVHVRRLDDGSARLALSHPLPLAPGDRALLRDPAGQRVAAGVLVLDVDPPGLRRRGAAVRRGAELGARGAVPDLATELARRGAASRTELMGLGVPLDDLGEAVVVGEWLVHPDVWQGWTTALRDAVAAHRRTAPLEAGLPEEAARKALRLPHAGLLTPLVAQAGLEASAGRVRLRGSAPDLGPAEAPLQDVERRLRETPFSPPESPELVAVGLGPRELAAAETAGRLVRLGGDVVLLPDGPARAMRVLAALPQPFTTSQARQALGTTRRVAVPLLELLDRRGWTRRLDGSQREVAR